MFPIVKKRQILVLLLVFAQATTMLSGVALLNLWFRSALRSTIHQQVLDDNVQTAKQMTNLVRQMNLVDLRSNRNSWASMQQAIRGIELPNDGFVCIVGADDGALICHPAFGEDLTKFPGTSSGTSSENLPKTMESKQAMIASSVQKAPDPKPAMKKELGMVKPQMTQNAMVKTGNQKTEQTTPEAQQEVRAEVREYDGELQMIAASYIPELNANLNVHQKSSGVEKRINAVMSPLVPVGTCVSLLLIFCTTAVTLVIMRRYDNRLAAINEGLEDTVEKRTQTLRKTRNAVIFGLAKLAESRDSDTGEHLERIGIYTTVLAGYLSRTDPTFDQNYIETLALASSLHDIGKVGIPDRILLKPGRFDADERAIMEKHSEYGGQCLQAIGEKLGEDDFLQLSRDIAYYHHERWDGSGYPLNLEGSAIPLSARIVAVADVYDALRSRRPYKDPMPHAKARDIIVAGRGSHFDPALVDAFLQCEDMFVEISDRYNSGIASSDPTPENTEVLHSV